ncbi:hypothetical protein [Chitinophaga varians]|uniref:hypothetical protein n=1 Tax=Chitinophaga varians TaxID=2202339 RepID=UPI00165F826A|nr:hypothetical protein [Chitinophaga varians]MBC9909375.1 hypothetical protein [Chitinophaga varians]
MCYYKDAQISIPQGQATVQELQPGSPLHAATLKGDKPVWEPVLVDLYQPSGGGQPRQAHLLFNNNNQMVTSVDQLLLLRTGQLIRADKLVPGTHQLVDKDGNEVGIAQVSIGTFGEAVYSLASNAPYAGTMDGHLLLANGVITGDYILQLNAEELTARGLIAAPQALPQS